MAHNCTLRVGRSLALGAAALTMISGASAASDDAVPIDEHTALMVGGGRFKVGLLSFEYGLTHNLSVGIDTPAWVSGAITAVFAPNAHLKLAVVQQPKLVVSGLVAFYYSRLTSTGARGDLVSVPATVFGSVNVAPRLWLHGELNYNWVRAFGAGDIGKATVNGSVATRSGQVGLMAEYRLTRVVALIARGRVQVLMSPLELRGQAMPDAFTHVDLAAEVRPAHPHPWMAVAGIALTWSHVGVVAGAGYGNIFIPGANLALEGVGFVPEGSVWVRF